jgi:CRP-like cAMP-binding protein
VLQSRVQPASRFLERLSAAARKSVLAKCETIDVRVGDEIYKQDGKIAFAYFPIDSMFSELTPSSDPPVEAYLTGREGMVGFVLALGAARAPMHCSVQGSGRALRVKARDFVKLLDAVPRLRDLAFSSAYLQLQQTSRNVYCMRHHQIAERLARWLLMAMDRHVSARFDVTHKFLAAMLGTRRTGVTVAASALQLQGLISYRRGEMVVVDRKGLERAACSCYAYSLEAQGNAFRA